MEHGASESGADEDDVPFRTPLPPDDRIWRHPSELSWPRDDAPAAAVERRGASSARRPWPTALVSGLVGSVLTVGVLAATGVLSEEPRIREVIVREAVAPAVSSSSGAGPGGVADLVADVAGTVVRIEVSGDSSGVGSGVVVRDDGHVVTNAHVIDGSQRITVVLTDGRRLLARVVGTDPETDLAVLRVDAGGPLAAAVLGSVEDVVVGDPAVAIGSPLGLVGDASVTSGIVSGLGREVESQDGVVLVDMIQTDAAIAPGSSGGALLDSRGVVVGITTAFAVTDGGAEGLGFATPIDVARAVADDLVEHGRVRKPWLGVKGDDATGGSGGAAVDEVMDGSPAAAAGIEDGDVIVGVDGLDVRGMSSLRVALRRHRPGDVIAVVLLRGDEQMTMDVALVERAPR